MEDSFPGVFRTSPAAVTLSPGVSVSPKRNVGKTALPSDAEAELEARLPIPMLASRNRVGLERSPVLNPKNLVSPSSATDIENMPSESINLVEGKARRETEAERILSL
jgi:hypothetical protein